MKRIASGLLLLLAAGAVTTASADVTNTTTTMTYTTIQAAIDDAATLDGHTLLVADGTYNENVTISKAIKLYSENGRASTTIEGISSVGALGAVKVDPDVDGAEIGAAGQGFTIIGIDNGAPGIENAAVYFQGNHAGAKVIDNEIVARGDHGLLAEYGATNSQFEITHNVFSGQTFLGANPAGNGFGSQFTLPNVPRQLVTIGCGGGCTSTSDILFADNAITGTAGGLNTSAEEQGNTLVTVDADNTLISGNTFAGTTTRYGTSLRARGPSTVITGNVFDSSGLSQTAGHVNMVSIGSTIADVVVANTFDRAAYVDGTIGNIENSLAVAAFGAADGSTVVALPGTYVEQVLIDSKTNVTIQGAGAGSTLIHAPATLATTFTTSGANKPVVTVSNSTGISIEDVTVDGLGNGNANNRFEGVAFYNAGGALLDSEVLDIRDTPASGVQHGVAVYAYVDDSGPYSLEIGNCVITGFQKNGTALSGDGLTVDVHDCTVTGAGYITYTAQNGIQVSYGATGTISDNVVDGIFYDVSSSYAASGFLIYLCPNVNMLGDNVATNSQESVAWYDASGTIDGFTCVAGPVPTASGYQDGVTIYNTTTPRTTNDRPVATLSPFVETVETSREARTSTTVALSNGCLTGSGFTNSFGVLADTDGEPLTVNMTNMTVTGWDYGLVADGAAATFNANDNAIAGNLSAGFDNTASGSAQNVEYNWWGAADGPSGAGPGTGDAIDETGFPGSVDFDPFRVDGTSSTACAFTPTVNNDVVIVPPAGTQCPEVCLDVDVDINRGDSAQMRGFSVTFQLDELELCGSIGSSILEGTYLNAIGSTHCELLDNGLGSYTIDCAILGLPCGQDAATGTLFSLKVQSTSTTGATGTITITDVTLRDCDNQPIPDTIGAPASIPMYDTTPPAAITDLAASQVLTGNVPPTAQTTGIQITFTAPVDAATVEVYRKGFGNYPEYDDPPSPGSMPAVPSYPPTGWTPTGVGTSGDIDVTGGRDYYYFVVFTKDTCGYVSGVSNMTMGTLNYHLGDVTDGSSPGTGDDLVNGLDISALGGSYGISLGPSDPVNYLDVGPTSDGSTQGLPQTDNLINFEDLILFAINYGQVSLTPPGGSDVSGSASRAAAPTLSLELAEPVGNEMVAKLVLDGDATAVKGAHAVVTYDASSLRLLGTDEGPLASDPSVFLGTIPGRSTMTIDAAVLGAGLTFPTSGVIAELRFAVLTPGARPNLGETELRDVDNGTVGSAVTVEPGVPGAIPQRLVLGARPNPFRATTHIVLELPAATEGSLRIYDVNGRLVATLADGAFTAGRHVTSWDGRGTDGRRVASGVYFYTFQGGANTVTKKLLRYE